MKSRTDLRRRLAAAAKRVARDASIRSAGNTYASAGSIDIARLTTRTRRSIGHAFSSAHAQAFHELVETIRARLRPVAPGTARPDLGAYHARLAVAALGSSGCVAIRTTLVEPAVLEAYLGHSVASPARAAAPRAGAPAAISGAATLVVAVRGTAIATTARPTPTGRPVSCTRTPTHATIADALQTRQRVVGAIVVGETIDATAGGGVAHARAATIRTVATATVRSTALARTLRGTLARAVLARTRPLIRRRAHSSVRRVCRHTAVGATHANSAALREAAAVVVAGALHALT